MKQTVRIIGGKYRGKKIHFPSIDGLRPTPDRVRETLFNWLMHDIRDTYCLDAFAGSGALGIEAFSRGAADVLLLEQDPIAYSQLQQQINTFASPNIRAQRTDACKFLQEDHGPFDIVFLDPPFKNNYLPSCINTLAQSNLLKTNGLVYVESTHTLPLDSNQWTPVKLKQAGQIVYGLYKKK